MAEVLTPAQIEAAQDAGATDLEISQIFNLKQRAAQFATALQNLLSWGDAVEGTELEAEYSRLVDSGFSIQEKVDSVLAQIDKALNWIRGILPDWMGLGNAGTLRPVGGQLGAFWFIPLAAIGVVLGLLGVWLSDYAKFAKKFAEQQRIARELQAEGVSPIEANRQAAASVAGTAPGMFANLSSPLMLLGLAGGGFLLWRVLQSKGR